MEPGETGFSAGAAVHAWRPSPSPLAPFLSRAAGEEGGMMPRLTYVDNDPPLISRAAGEEGGMMPPHLSPPPFRFATGSGSGEIRVAVAILRLRLSTIPRP